MLKGAILCAAVLAPWRWRAHTNVITQERDQTLIVRFVSTWIDYNSDNNSELMMMTMIIHNRKHALYTIALIQQSQSHFRVF